MLHKARTSVLISKSLAELAAKDPKLGGAILKQSMKCGSNKTKLVVVTFHDKQAALTSQQY